MSLQKSLAGVAFDQSLGEKQTNKQTNNQTNKQAREKAIMKGREKENKKGRTKEMQYNGGEWTEARYVLIHVRRPAASRPDAGWVFEKFITNP